MSKRKLPSASGADTNSTKKKPVVTTHDLLTFFMITVVCFIQALAINGFYGAHGLLSGGITGISFLLDYMFGIPKWVGIVVLNIPVCVVGFICLKPRFVVFSVIGTLILALAVALTDGFTIPVENELVATLIGAAIIGVTSAPIVKRDATLGGLDVVSVILSKRFSVQIGSLNIIFNLFIMAALAFVKGLEIALLSIIAMFVSNVAFNFALSSLNKTVSVFIISDEWDEIAPEVLNALHRGVTYIPAEGAYTGEPRKLVYCIVRASEISKLKRIVKSKDERALFSIVETKEVVGRGFGSLN